MSMLRTGVSIVSSLLVLGLGTGCDSIKEKLVEKAAEKAAEKAIGNGAEVDLGSSSGSATVRDNKTGAVLQAGTGAKLPDGWPSEVPPYPGGKIMASVGTPDAMTVTMSTTDDASAIIAFYKGKLGGKVESEVDMGGQMKTFAVVDGANRVVVATSNLGNGTTVTINVSKKK